VIPKVSAPTNRPKPPYPSRPGRTLVFIAETFERHGYLSANGLTREFDHIYRYVIDSDGWLFHRLVTDEFGRTLGKAFRWQRSAHGDPYALAASQVKKWQERRTHFTVLQALPNLPDPSVV
jgi:hypothetical protein